MGLGGFSLDSIGMHDDSEQPENESELFKEPKQKEGLEGVVLDEEESLDPIGFVDETLDDQVVAANIEGSDETNIEQASGVPTTIKDLSKSKLEHVADRYQLSDRLNNLKSDSDKAVEAAFQATSQTEESRIIKETHYKISDRYLNKIRKTANEVAGEETKDEKGKFDSIIDKYDQGRGIEGFYKDYSELVVYEHDPHGKIKGETELKLKLGKSLGADKANAVYESLTSEEVIKGYELAIRNKQLAKLAEIDEKKGTHHIADVHRLLDPANAPTIQTLHKLDEYLEEVARIEGNEELTELIRLGRATPTGRLMLEERIEAAVNHKLNPSTQMEAIITVKKYAIDQGMFDLMNDMLQEEVTVLPNGTIKCSLHGDEVYLVSKGNIVTAYIVDSKNNKYLIRRTNPNAVGFDHARTIRDCTEMGATLFVDSTELRSGFLDNLDDNQFMDKMHAEYNKELIAAMAGNHTQPIRLTEVEMNLLHDLDIVSKDNMPTKILTNLGEWLRRKAPTLEGMRALRQLLTPDDIRTLIYMWKHDEDGSKLSTPEFKPYSLEEVRRKEVAGDNPIT